ncbi:MAG: patatin-like phospholipase family protein [Crocosphaera sp.]|nr:patatin-like phospholipase family protein [Crocosphaera sp.]
MNSSHQKQFKILSLDGGGVRGMISATIVKEIEHQLELYCQKNNQPILKLHDYFDVVAGTSTGSILAAGIASKMSANQLIELYQNQTQMIFDKGTRFQRKWGQLLEFIPQNLSGQFGLYPNQKGKGLAKVLQEKLVNEQGKPVKFNEIKNPILFIPAYDTYSRNTTWFASNRVEQDNCWFKDIEVWQLCVASAAAPTFFSAYPLPYSDGKLLPHIDGGVSANNPSLSAIAHLLVTEKNSNLNNISVLSVGTGKTTKVFTYDNIKKWSLLEIIKHLPHIFLDPGSQNTEAICQEFLRSVSTENPYNYLRLDFDLNQAFKGDRGNTLREPEKSPKNQYLGEPISEEIDDPNLCVKRPDRGKSLLQEVAEAYLEQENIGAKIRAFLEHNTISSS